MVISLADTGEHAAIGGEGQRPEDRQPRSRGRRRSRYTDLGKKLASLAANQAELSRVLGLTQQSISGKLTGKIAITLKDLQRLSTYYSLPTLYFFTPESVSPEIARMWEQTMKQPNELQDFVRMSSSLSPSAIQELMRIAKSMKDGRSIGEA